MKRFLHSYFNVRKGEWGPALLMFSYSYLIMLTYYFLKPASKSLFLTYCGSEQLPHFYILTALIVVPVTTFYSRASRSIGLSRLIGGTTAIIIISLVFIHWLFQLGESWVYYMFSIFVSIYGILTVSQFWLMANAVYNAEQGKRLFVMLNLGLNIGAVTGGEVISLIINKLSCSTEDLLYFCMGTLLVTILILSLICRLSRSRELDVPQAAREVGEQRKDTFSQMFGSIKRSRHLLLIVGLITITVFAAQIVAYQFESFSAEAIQEKEQLTAFLGKVLGRVSLFAFIFQAFFVYRFIKALGVGGVILFLPMGLLAASGAMLIFPFLWAAVLLRIADGGFRYSIDQTGRELLFLPVPLEIKKRTKLFIDVFVNRFSRGTAGALLLVCTMLHLGLRQISLIMICVIGVWVILVIRARKEYVNTFRMALAKREIDLDELRTSITDPETVKTLLAELESPQERRVLYALDMLASAKNIDFSSSLMPMLGHKSAEVRLKVVKLLGDLGKLPPIPRLQELVHDLDTRVRKEAMRLLCGCEEIDSAQTMKEYLEHKDPGVRASTVSCIAKHGKPEEKSLVSEDRVRQLLESDNEEVRVQVTEALGALGNPDFYKYLDDLIEDASPAVASKAISSMGATGDRRFVPLLLEKLTDKRHRKDARKALSAFGTRITGTLSDHLTDDSVDFLQRASVLSVMELIPEQATVNSLTARLESLEPSLKYRAIKVLNKLRSKYPDLRFDKARIDATLIEETKGYYEVLQVLHLHGRKEDKPAGKLLSRALQETLDRNLERIFRVLGLRYPQKDIYSAYLGMVSRKENLRASSIEFLDNLLGKNIKRYLLPILGQDSMQMTVERGQKLFDFRLRTFEEGLKHLISGRDPWLKACAIYNLPADAGPELKSLIEKARNDSDLVVRETARLVLSKPGADETG